ncbi:MAG: GTPase Era [Myxococcota bacterium]
MARPRQPSASPSPSSRRPQKGPGRKPRPPRQEEPADVEEEIDEDEEDAEAAGPTEVVAGRQIQLPAGPHRAGFVALIGRPNVGKSTLLNALLGAKLAAISPKPQTTRRRLRAIMSLKTAQVVLVDTPGLFDGAVLPDGGTGGYGKLGTFMAREAKSALSDVDAVIFVVEPGPRNRPVTEVGAAEAAIAKLIRESRKPCILAINKIDMVEKPLLLPLLDTWKETLPFAALVPISAEQREGLDRLVQEVVRVLPESPPLFPTSTLTDATEREVVAEMIREKAMILTGEEVPYAIAVEVDRFDESRREGRGKKPGIVEIDATIHVEREGQKAIVVGKGGTKVKEIGVRARGDVERFLGCQVMLRLYVKVSDRWTRSDRAMRGLGYG